MLAKVELENTEQVEIQRMWQSIVEDSLRDRGRDNKRLGVVCWVMAAVILLMAGLGLYCYDLQQTKYLAQIESLTVKMENQQKEFIAFLSEYSFETITIEGTQDGYGVNQMGGGNVTNGATGENSSTPDEAQGREISGDNNETSK